jgi:SAM-dependent methyltransferase
MEHRAYGWRDARAHCSHAYLIGPVFAFLDEHLGGRRGKILDLGCGNGIMSARLAEAGHDVTGADVSPDGIEQARIAHPRIPFHVASIYDDDLASVVGRGFDAIVSLEVIEHLFYPKLFFERTRGLLLDGGRGRLIGSTPYHGYLKNLALSVTGHWDKHFGVDWDGGHIKFFSPATLRLMAERAGYRDVRLRYAGRVPGLWKTMIFGASPAPDAGAPHQGP